MSSAICFNLDQPKILLSGNGLINEQQNFRLDQVESICRKQINIFSKMTISIFDRLEKVFGKGENADIFL